MNLLTVITDEVILGAMIRYYLPGCFTVKLNNSKEILRDNYKEIILREKKNKEFFHFLNSCHIQC